MTTDRQGFLQDRLNRSHQEQVWAVALVGGMNGFAITQGKTLVAALGMGRLTFGIAAACTLALLFLWSRFLIYRRYDHLLQDLIERGPAGQDFHVRGARRLARTLISGTGTLLYSLVLIATTWAALAVLRNP